MMVRVNNEGEGYGAWPVTGVTTDLNTWGDLLIDMDDKAQIEGSDLQEDENPASGFLGLQGAIIIGALAFVAAIVYVFLFKKARWYW